MLRPHRRAHLWLWRALLIVLPAILLTSWLLRPGKLPEPVLLSAPGQAK